MSKMTVTLATQQRMKLMARALAASWKLAEGLEEKVNVGIYEKDDEWLLREGAEIPFDPPTTPVYCAECDDAVASWAIVTPKQKHYLCRHCYCEMLREIGRCWLRRGQI